MDDLSLAEIAAIVLRQKKRFLFVFILTLIVCSAVALRWSNYRSTATVGIRDAEIASHVTDTSANGNTAPSPPDIRIGKIEWQVKSVESLASIIDKFHLYASARDTTPIEPIHFR